MSNWLRSLRLRLQVWHALILLLVIVGFGLVLYRQMVRARWADIDGQLLAAGRILEGALRAVPRAVLDSLAKDIGAPRRPLPPPPPRPRDGGQPLPPRGEPADRGRPGGGFFPPGPRPLEWERVPEDASQRGDWERLLALPRSLPETLARGEDEPAYFIIWRRDGSILRQVNSPLKNRERPAPSDLPPGRPPLSSRQEGPYHEVFLRGPEDSLICVGRSVRREQVRFMHLALQLTLAGAVIFAGGLLGGWWLSVRAIAPIKRMSETAAKINATNLSQRMDLSGVDLELEQLGVVLNTMLERLDSAFAAQQRFTADASHELRTPLAVMLSTIELGLAKPRTPEEYRDQLLKCQRAAVRMRGLIDSLLTLARVDQASEELLREVVRLDAVAEECIDALEPLAQERQVRLTTRLDAVAVAGDAGQLGQVVTNLVANAIEYSHPQGEVTIELRAIAGSAELAVTDTGIGIPEPALPHLFERFYRVDAARSRSRGGSGLGLAICHRIVTAHGGTIQVKSDVGRGSTFTLRLPAVSPEATPQATAPA